MKRTTVVLIVLRVGFSYYSHYIAVLPNSVDLKF